MSRRIEIELTSERPDGTWTWRAAGAKQPKGDLVATVLPEGAKVGDVVKADADFTIDGIEILGVLTNKRVRKEPETLQVVGTRQDEPLVTTTLVEKGSRPRGEGRGPRRDGGGRGRDGGKGRDGGRDRGDRPNRDRSDRPQGDRSRGPRPDPVPERPKPQRLRPGRAHRSAVLDTLPVEHRPIAEQVLRGGIPAVRDAIAQQNAQAKKDNQPEIPADQLVDLAEKLLPALRAAEWRDRADAVVADLDTLDLRDLRSVIVAADGVARDDESLALKDKIQEGLTRRVEEEQAMWIADMTANLDAGRFVRVLRLSSRPPKAGAPLPVDISSRLITAVSEGLTPTVNQDLWAAALDALAFSPVRSSVVPAGRPEEPSETLLEAVRRVGDRLPKIVELFGLDPAEIAAASRKRGRGPRAGQGAGRGGKQSSKNKAAKGSEKASDKAADKSDKAAADRSDQSDKGASVKADAATDNVAETPDGETPVVGATEAPEAVETTDAPAGAETTQVAPEADAAPEATEVEAKGADEAPEAAEVPEAGKSGVESE
ncbi:MAG: hypothetical protein WBA45_09160 [Microthrixaceae bacterium]